MGTLVGVQQMVEGLKEGKTILYPTDTIWGLGCDSQNIEAIQKIKDIKHRSSQKSFIVLVDSVAMLERYVQNIPDVCYDLIDFSEKPTTIIYDRIEGLPDILKAEDGSLGIRVTKDNFCRKLIAGIRRPLVSTSANISGEASPKCYSEISKEIVENVDLILEERLEEIMVSPSSIIKIGNNNNVKILR